MLLNLFFYTFKNDLDLGVVLMETLSKTIRKRKQPTSSFGMERYVRKKVKYFVFAAVKKIFCVQYKFIFLPSVNLNLLSLKMRDLLNIKILCISNLLKQICCFIQKSIYTRA